MVRNETRVKHVRVIREIAKACLVPRGNNDSVGKEALLQIVAGIRDSGRLTEESRHPQASHCMLTCYNKFFRAPWKKKQRMY